MTVVNAINRKALIVRNFLNILFLLLPIIRYNDYLVIMCIYGSQVPVVNKAHCVPILKLNKKSTLISTTPRRM